MRRSNIARLIRPRQHKIHTSIFRQLCDDAGRDRLGEEIVSCFGKMHIVRTPDLLHHRQRNLVKIVDGDVFFFHQRDGEEIARLDAVEFACRRESTPPLGTGVVVAKTSLAPVFFIVAMS